MTAEDEDGNGLGLGMGVEWMCKHSAVVDTP